jgi:hypothetical protein
MNRLASISNEHHVTRGEHVAVNEALALIQKNTMSLKNNVAHTASREGPP